MRTPTILCSLLFAVPLLGESLDFTTVAFGLAVVATVFIGKRMPVNTPHPISTPEHTKRSLT